MIADSWDEAKLLINMKRAVAPVNHSERSGGKKYAQNRKMDDLVKKAALITELKRILFVFNQATDKRMVQVIRDEDLDELDELIDDDDEPDGENQPNSSVDIENEPLSLAPAGDDDVFVVEDLNQAVLPGAQPLQTDRKFSKEYTYSVDVRTFEHFPVDIVNDKHILKYLQASGNRNYVHCQITLSVVVVDKLKEWNISRSTILRDKKFVRLLLINVIGSLVLKESTAESLDVEKLRFIRG